MAQRTATGALRLAVLERDSYECRYCGDADGPFHIDHVLPWSRGGRTELPNLVTACIPCNLRKRDAVWQPRPLREGWPATKESAARRLTLARIASEFGHNPRWIPTKKKRAQSARWFCSCGIRQTYPIPITHLPWIINAHLRDAIGEPCLEDNGGPPAFMLCA